MGSVILELQQETMCCFTYGTSFSLGLWQKQTAWLAEMCMEERGSLLDAWLSGVGQLKGPSTKRFRVAGLRGSGPIKGILGYGRARWYMANVKTDIGLQEIPRSKFFPSSTRETSIRLSAFYSLSLTSHLERLNIGWPDEFSICSSSYSRDRPMTGTVPTVPENSTMLRQEFAELFEQARKLKLEATYSEEKHTNGRVVCSLQVTTTAGSEAESSNGRAKARRNYRRRKELREKNKQETCDNGGAVTQTTMTTPSSTALSFYAEAKRVLGPPPTATTAAGRKCWSSTTCREVHWWRAAIYCTGN